MNAWIASGCEWAVDYASAWETALGRGSMQIGPDAGSLRSIEADQLTKEEFGYIGFFGSLDRPPSPTFDPAPAQVEGGPPELAGDANPFTWEVADLIVKPMKLQWTYRHALARATWKALRACLAELGRTPTGNALEAAATARAKKFRQDKRFVSFIVADQYSRAPLIGIDRRVRFRPDEFRTFASLYFGLRPDIERAAISLQIGSLTTLGNVKIMMEMANRAAGRSFRRDQTRGELLDEWEVMFRSEDAARGRTGHGAGFLVSREQGVGGDC